MLTPEQKAKMEERNRKLAEIMVEYCPDSHKEYPLCERMGATILALHDKMEMAKSRGSF